MGGRYDLTGFELSLIIWISYWVAKKMARLFGLVVKVMEIDAAEIRMRMEPRRGAERQAGSFWNTTRGRDWPPLTHAANAPPAACSP